MNTRPSIPSWFTFAAVVFVALVLPHGAGAQEAYVPFRVEIPGGLADSGPSPSSNPEITIDSSGTSPFVVTSIIIKRALMNPVDFSYFTVVSVTINGTQFDTRTGNLFGPLGNEYGVLQSADIMGMPVRQGHDMNSGPGGNVPQEIVANGAGSPDIVVRLFCRSDNRAMNIATILVMGWKKPSDTVKVSYRPGQ